MIVNTGVKKDKGCLTLKHGSQWLLLAVSFGSSVFANADFRYISSVIELPGDLQHYRTADFNGDKRQDVIVSVLLDEATDKEKGVASRELFVYLQQPDGKFLSTPSKRIELKKDIVAYGIADVRADAGEELLFFSRTAFFSFSTRSESYANNLQKLGEWSLITSMPNPRNISFIGPFSDVNNDGKVDLWLPGINGYGLFYSSGEGFSFAGHLAQPFHHPQEQRATGSIGFDSRRGLMFILENANTRQPLIPIENNNNVLEQSRLLRNAHPLLNWERWQAGVTVEDINNDKLQDFLFVDDVQAGEENRKQLNIIINNASTNPATDNDLRKSDDKKALFRITHSMVVPANARLTLGDWNGDELPDLIAIDHQDAGEAVVSFFSNIHGKFDTEKAKQVMKFSGYDVDVNVLDINNDGQPELLVSYYSLSAVDAVRNGNMLRTTLIYAAGTGNDAEPVFQRRPVVKLEEKFSSSTFRGLTQRLRLSDDFNGDGIHDAVSVDSEGAVVIKQVSANLSLPEEYTWRFVPLHLITWFQPQSLNSDGRADAVLSHQRALTMLVSE